MIDKHKEIRDGIEVNVYDNGAIQNASTGHWIKPPEGGSITTTERSRELLARRWEISRQRAIEGIDEAAIEAGKIPKTHAGSGAGWKHIVKHVASTLLTSRNLRGQAEAANFLGKASGELSQNENSESFAVAFIRLFQKFADQNEDIIEGEIK